MALTRRALGRMLASGAAFLTVPFHKVFAAAPKAKATLRGQVQAAVDALGAESINAALDGTYAKVFNCRQSTMQVEQVVHMHYRGLSDIKNGAVSRIDWDDKPGQRWVFNAETEVVGFGFAVVRDDDLRGVSADRATIASISQMKQEPAGGRPVRLSEVPATLARMLAIFRIFRETDAAAILSNATTYDPTIGGDGVSLCSPNHPHHTGTWQNTLPTPCDLTFEALLEAGKGIELFVDEQGLRINVKPMRLIVGRDYVDLAKRLTTPSVDQGYVRLPYLVWDEISPDAWFLQTDVDGLVWFERHPFELAVWEDHETGAVWVQGYERRCFSYHDPRAVFGVVPPRIQRA